VKQAARAIAYPIILAALAACSDSGPTGPQSVVASVRVSPEAVLVSTPGHVERFTATAFDAEGAVVDGLPVLWRSGDPSVVSIDADGVARALGLGLVTIEAMVGGISGLASFAISPDTTPPALRDVSFTPVRVNVLNQAARVTLRANLSDAGSGVSGVSALFRNSAGATTDGLITLSHLPGDGPTEAFEGLLIVPANATPGVWTLLFVQAVDSAGNQRTWETDALRERNINVELLVTHGG